MVNNRRTVFTLTLACTLLMLTRAAHADSSEAGNSLALWIDADPACVSERDRNDVDDCWAIGYAMQSPAFEVAGLSSVFGNDSEDVAFATLLELRRRHMGMGATESRDIDILRGSPRPLSEGVGAVRDEFVDRMISELSVRQLTIVALGPLTNIARLLASGRPELGNIKEIVIVAGTRAGSAPFYLNGSRWFRFSDFNFAKDPLAAEIVIHSSVPVTMVPFEVSSQVVIDSATVNDVANAHSLLGWAASRSGSWLRFMERWSGMDGFHPFDLMALLYLEHQAEFEASQMYARVSRERRLLRDRLNLVVEAEPSYNGQVRVTYVHGVASGFSESLRSVIR